MAQTVVYAPDDVPDFPWTTVDADGVTDRFASQQEARDAAQ